METEPFINPIIEKLMDGTEVEKKKLDQILGGKSFYIMGRKYKIVSR